MGLFAFTSICRSAEESSRKDTKAQAAQEKSSEFEVF